MAPDTSEFLQGKLGACICAQAGRAAAMAMASHGGDVQHYATPGGAGAGPGASQPTAAWAVLVGQGRNCEAAGKAHSSLDGANPT